MWKVCEAYNAHGWAAECLAFLSLDQEVLDLGFSAPLQAEAKELPSERESVAYLVSYEVGRWNKHIVL